MAKLVLVRCSYCKNEGAGTPGNKCWRCPNAAKQGTMRAIPVAEYKERLKAYAEKR